MSKDNVVQFASPQASEKEQEEQLRKYVQQIQQQRKQGLKDLSDVVEKVSDQFQLLREELGDEPFIVKGEFFLENLLRDINRGLDSAHLSLRAIDTTLDLFIQDVGGYIANLQETQKVAMITGMNIDSVVSILETKGVFTREELNEVYQGIREGLVKKPD